MQQNGRGVKQGDRLLKSHGKTDRGPVEFKTHIAEQEGEIMAIATRDVISVPPTQSILSAVGMMTKCGFRRLPVTDPGTKKLRGIITSGDIINFMGGGDKYKLVQVRHGGNLIAALNENVRTIMTQQITTLPHTSHVRDAVETIVRKKIGGLPLVDNDGVLKRHRDGTRCAAGPCRRAEPAQCRGRDDLGSRVTAPGHPDRFGDPRHDEVQVPPAAGRERRCPVWDHHRHRYYAVSRELAKCLPG